MRKEEVEELIVQVKREIVFYQRTAIEENFDKNRVEEQLNKYLDTLQLLLKLLETAD